MSAPLRSRRGVKEIRGLAPPMQFFIVSLFNKAMNAKYAGDVEKYAKAVWMIYMNLPTNIKKEITEKLGSNPVVKELIGEERPVTPMHVIEQLEAVCGQYVSTYEQFKDPYDKRMECRAKLEDYLDIIYDEMVDAVFNHNFLVIMSSPILYGGYLGGDYMDAGED